MGQRRRKVPLFQELHQCAFCRLHAGGLDPDGSVVQNDGLTGDGPPSCIDAAGSGRGSFPAGRGADGEKCGKTELVFDVAGQRAEIAVLTEEAGQTAPGGLVGDGQIGGKGTVGAFVGEKPLKGEAGVEVKELAETFRKAAIALEGGVIDGDAMVGEVFFQTAFAGGNLFLPVGQRVVPEGVVERGGEVGQAGTEAEADEKGTWRDGSIGGEFTGRGRAAKGRGIRAFFAETLATAELAEE